MIMHKEHAKEIGEVADKPYNAKALCGLELVVFNVMW
jgi:hypothetical protein